jgi:TRAP-type C4-dicarboxylate transport system permease small subunit
VEGEIILKGLGLIGFGLLFIWLGVTGWRNRRENRISVIEAAILRAADAGAQPPNRWDRVWAYIQPVLMLTFGPLMLLGGIAVLSLLGE